MNDRRKKIRNNEKSKKENKWENGENTEWRKMKEEKITKNEK